MSKLVIVLLTLILFFPLSSCDDNPSPSQTDPREVYDAHETIGKIFIALKVYRSDNSQDPVSVEELEAEGYVTIDPEMKKFWSFHLIGCNPVIQIYAESTDQHPDGAGHIIIFDVQRGVFSSYGSLKDSLCRALSSVRAGAINYTRSPAGKLFNDFLA